ncbi:ADP-ribosylglycohydrolase family protein [Adhaeretor mobilis]|uniref:ADP-ribosyl-[dinitrogen reductase] glycohydrolase n=1 Tax=Adhaeretor mobilis TaxID=1930276 RepID=A0A517MRS8_9BACT|nr:ADP-ribosylglycohydrolase family protein [Adhaeretor mobilis]QDS97585.1 ADP-ribosyl-[dinitrogen reductase] glycohydrolase [Adhaeretor mobilis]
MLDKSQPTIESRFEGCLLGLAVGDALGAPFEGMSADDIAQRYPSAQDLIENPPPEELCYTDDTQMAIGVAETLVKCGRINERELCKRFVANYSPERGYGAGAKIVLEAMVDERDHKVLAANHFPGGSFGNGAAMRVAPVGLMFRHDHERLWREARLSALPTHVHPLGIEGAQLLALAVGIASTIEAFDRDDFFASLAEKCQSQDYTDPLRKASLLSDVGASDVRDLALFGNGIEATSSVVTAIAAFAMSPNSYDATIGNAILLGGDTDTIAAMAGAISGAYLGITAIPFHLLEHLEDQEQGASYLQILASKLRAAHEKIAKAVA